MAETETQRSWTSHDLQNRPDATRHSRGPVAGIGNPSADTPVRTGAAPRSHAAEGTRCRGLCPPGREGPGWPRGGAWGKYHSRRRRATRREEAPAGLFGSPVFCKTDADNDFTCPKQKGLGGICSQEQGSHPGGEQRHSEPLRSSGSFLARVWSGDPGDWSS